MLAEHLLTYTDVTKGLAFGLKSEAFAHYLIAFNMFSFKNFTQIRNELPKQLYVYIAITHKRQPDSTYQGKQNK